MQFKDREFTEEEVKLMEALVLNGVTIEQIAKKYYGVLPTTWALNMKREVNQWARTRLNAATETFLAEATQSLHMKANGYEAVEKEYVVDFDFDPALIDKYSKLLIYYLTEKRVDEFKKELLNTIKCTEDKSISKVKIKTKHIPPDFNSIELILKAHNEEVWDLDAKRKKIPDVKITVGLEGEAAAKYLNEKKGRGKEIPADFTVETK